MTPKTKGVFILAFFLIGFVTFAIVYTKFSNQQSEKEYLIGLKYLGDTQFKGKVVSVKKYEWAGKDYYKICIKLDYTNKQDFFVYNDLAALCVKNDTAIMAAGVFVSGWGPVQYVEFNLNNSHLLRYHYKDGTVHSFNLSIRPEGLTQTDFTSCN
jgi:hypothetical protein